MKPSIVLLLIVLTTTLLTTAFSAAGQKAYMHLNNKDTAGKTYTTNNENALTELKNAFIAGNAKITQEDSTSFVAELPNSTWAWESRDGSPDNDKAIVVINKAYDIGANKIKKPKSVTTIWLVSVAADKKSYTIKLQDVLSIYGFRTKYKTGYCTGIWEERVSSVIK